MEVTTLRNFNLFSSFLLPTRLVVGFGLRKQPYANAIHPEDRAYVFYPKLVPRTYEKVLAPKSYHLELHHEYRQIMGLLEEEDEARHEAVK